MRSRRTRLGLGAALSVLLASCAATPKQLTAPRPPTATSCLVAGNVRVFDTGKDVTRKCKIVFTDETNYPKGNAALDASGWVFAYLSPGRTSLSYVECAFAMSTSRFYTQAIGFDVDAPDLATYFGHVEIELSPNMPSSRGAAQNAAEATLAKFGPNPLATAVVVLLTYAMAQTEGEAPKTLTYGKAIGAEDGVWSVKKAYMERYRESLALPVTSSLVGQAPASNEERVTRRGNLLYASADLAGFHLVWLGTVRGATGQLALRFVPSEAEASFDACQQAEVSIDERQLSIPLTRQVPPASSTGPAYLQGIIDSETLKSMTSATATRFTLCGLTRRLNGAGVKAGTALLERYDALRAEARTDASPALPAEAANNDPLEPPTPAP